MKMHRRMALATAILIGMSCSSTVFGGSDAREINERIRALREKLDQFRGDRGLIEKKVVLSRDPAELSEELENRKDARMVVLFHDGATRGTKVENAREANDSTSAAMGASAEPKSAVELALEKIRGMAEARRRMDPPKDQKAPGGIKS
ncbi:MAG: hypothetical protein WA705_26865 [Candidatus Ozemobacteraceae bacterium]